MEVSLYSYTVFAGALTTALLSVCLLLSRAPLSAGFEPYNRARKLLGASLCFYSAGISVFVFCPGLRSRWPEMASAVNLTYYFPAALLFGYSFIQLLDRRYFCIGRSRRFLLTWIAFSLLLWVTVLFTDGGLCRGLLFGFGAWFLIQTVILIVRFFKTYSRACRDIDDYYSDRTELFVRWLRISAWLVIVCGVFGGFAAFLPSWYNVVYMWVGIAAFAYIYISLQNYALNYEAIAVAVNPEQPVVKANAQDAGRDLGQRISSWIESKGYLDPSLTIISLAETLKTNRTYLSAHINNVIGKNFSEWVNGLRLSHARSLLLSEPDKTIEEISALCGFSSQAYFSRQFKHTFGTTPGVFRKQAYYQKDV